MQVEGVVNRGVHAEEALLGHHQIDEICKAFRRHRVGQVESVHKTGRSPISARKREPSKILKS